MSMQEQEKTIYLADYSVPDFFIDATDLHFDLQESDVVVSSQLTLRRNIEAKNPSASLRLDGVELELLECSIDGVLLKETDYEIDEESLTIKNVTDEFIFRCKTRIYPKKNTSLEGLYQSSAMFCTQCEAQGFRKITYYLDRPDVLSIFTTTVEACATQYPVLLSNGNLQQSKSCGNGRHSRTWEDPFRKPCYLFALVAGELEKVTDEFVTMSGRCVALELFVEEKDVNKCAHALTSLKKAMKWDEDVYGREYDLDVFMIVAVDDFNMGAMENKGLNIFNTSCVLANPQVTTDAAYQRVEAVVAHEYFHNWSGNRVTCRDWFQLSLKEGFTVYRDAEFSADMNSRGVKRIEDVNMLRSIQFTEDSGPMAHPIRPASFVEISNFYTVTVYEKGAEVVRMLAELLGPQDFRCATDLYFSRFDGQAVTCDDFVDVMEEVSGEDLNQFRRWYSQAGVPEVTINCSHDEHKRTMVIDMQQSCPPTPETPKGESKLPFVIPVKIGFVTEEGNCETQFQNKTSTDHVLVLKESSERYEIQNVDRGAVPSILRGFSAPVKITIDATSEELLFLWKFDTDPYARWNAGQQLAVRSIFELVDDLKTGKPVHVNEYMCDGMEYLIGSESFDLALKSVMLTLPNEAYLSEQISPIPVELIHQARTLLMQTFAERLNWEGLYLDLHARQLAYAPTADQIGLRQLKNLALQYLMYQKGTHCVDLAIKQYSMSDNMTDSASALRAIVHSSNHYALEKSQDVLDDFQATWVQEPLVMNTWLQIQATIPSEKALGKVHALMNHAVYDNMNPNKVRSLIGAFTRSNSIGFHQNNGEGYTLLVDEVMRLNHKNPQLAARLLTPLTQWRKYEKVKQGLMKGELKKMSQKSLSKDVYEVIMKSL